MDKLSRFRPLLLILACLIPWIAGGAPALAADQLYWVEAGAIRRAAVDGQGVAQVLSANDAQAVFSMALAPGNGAMFWGAWIPEQFSGEIRRATLQGDEIVPIANPWSEGMGSLTVDSMNDRIYYTDPSDCVPDCGSIWRMDQDGSNRERILQQDTPFAIAVCASAGRVCWGDQYNLWIRCSDLDGGDIQTVVLETNVQSLAIDPTSEKLYWTDEGNQAIRRSNLDGSAIEDLVTGLDDPWGIALDSASGRMFWTDRGAGKIQSAGLDGSSPTDIVTGLDSPTGIAFLPQSGGVVPAASGWGLVVLTLLLLVTSTFLLLRPRSGRSG